MDETKSVKRSRDINSQIKKCLWDVQNNSSLGGLEPPTFRLTAERANRLRHRDSIRHEVSPGSLQYNRTRIPLCAEYNTISGGM